MKMCVSDSNTPITCRSENDTEKFMENRFMTLKFENSKEGRSVCGDALGRLSVQAVQH
jgi:hypothetical protein